MFPWAAARDGGVRVLHLNDDGITVIDHAKTRVQLEAGQFVAVWGG